MRCNGIYITVIYIYMETNISQLWKRIFSSSQLPFFKGDMDSFPGHVAPKSSRSSHQRSFRSKEVKSYNSPTCNTARLLPFCLRKANRFPKPSCQNPKKKKAHVFFGGPKAVERSRLTQKSFSAIMEVENHLVRRCIFSSNPSMFHSKWWTLQIVDSHVIWPIPETYPPLRQIWVVHQRWFLLHSN